MHLYFAGIWVIRNPTEQDACRVGKWTMLKYQAKRLSRLFYVIPKQIKSWHFVSTNKTVIRSTGHDNNQPVTFFSLFWFHFDPINCFVNASIVWKYSCKGHAAATADGEKFTEINCVCLERFCCSHVVCYRTRAVDQFAYFLWWKSFTYIFVDEMRIKWLN